MQDANPCCTRFVGRLRGRGRGRTGCHYVIDNDNLGGVKTGAPARMRFDRVRNRDEPLIRRKPAHRHRASDPDKGVRRHPSAGMGREPMGKNRRLIVASFQKSRPMQWDGDEYHTGMQERRPGPGQPSRRGAGHIRAITMLDPEHQPAAIVAVDQRGPPLIPGDARCACNHRKPRRRHRPRRAGEPRTCRRQGLQ